MRTMPYKDVLWAVAVKMGLDPTRDLHGEHADALAIYINSWVRRLWHNADWPEWTRTEPRSPDARHMVSWDEPFPPPPPGVDSRISRVLKVYLNDPDITPPPLEITPRFSDVGIHCGFEHGTQVWIKFQPPPPQYTAQVWDAQRTYNRGELAYSPISGECYKSKSSSNQNHNPAGDRGMSAPPLTVNAIQEYMPDSPGRPGQSQINEIQVTAGNVIGSHTVLVIATAPPTNGSTIVTVTHDTGAGETLATITATLAAALTAAPGMAGFTITTPGSATTIRLEKAAGPFAVSQAYSKVPTGPSVITTWFPVKAVQTYIPTVPFVAGTAQIMELQLSDTQALPFATYTLLFHDFAGLEHVLEYVNPERNSSVEVLQGIVFELQRLADLEPDGDPFWDGILAAIDTTTLRLQFAIRNRFSLDATMTLAGSPWWDWIHFPACLADPVIRGGEADGIREEGQSDKANSEEMAAGAEASNEQAPTWQPLPFDPLTDQTRPAPRYKIAGAAAPTQKG